MFNTIGFIFARGGSKGLPGKNIKILRGKPLIVYSIEAGFASALLDKIFVSTDDEKIAQIARNCGVEVIERPLQLAQDSSSEWEAWKHAIHYVKGKYGDFNEFVSLPATSPLRSKNDIVNAILKRRRMKADVCIGITPATRNPYFNMVKENNRGFFEIVNTTEGLVERRQDAPIIYDITTAVYVATTAYVLGNDTLFSGNVTAIDIPRERAVDIDDIYDFIFAEAILNYSSNENA